MHPWIHVGNSLWSIPKVLTHFRVQRNDPVIQHTSSLADLLPHQHRSQHFSFDTSVNEFCESDLEIWSSCHGWPSCACSHVMTWISQIMRPGATKGGFRQPVCCCSGSVSLQRSKMDTTAPPPAALCWLYHGVTGGVFVLRFYSPDLRRRDKELPPISFSG